MHHKKRTQMIKWRLISFSLTACICSSVVTAAEHTHANSPVPLYPEFTQFFEERLQSDKVPGGIFAVVKGDQIQHIHAFGVRSLSSPEPVTADTVFRIASVSKTFAAGLAARLEYDQRFNWTDPLTQYVPEFTFANPEYSNKVQVQHLLTHSVGIVPNAYDNLIEANYSSEQIVPYFQRLNPLCEPGQCYGYQNVLFNLIENVLEKSTGSTYPELLSEYVFDPLGMTHSSVGIEGYQASENKAMPHVRGSNRWFERQVTSHYYHFPAAAGVNTTARDLAQWLIAQLGYRSDVLPDEVLADIRQPRVRTSRDLRRRSWRQHLTNAHYGLGWRLYDLGEHSLVYHGGWVSGFRADIAYSPEHEIGLIVLLNAESNVISEISTSFWADILPRMKREQWVPYYHASRAREELTTPIKEDHQPSLPSSWGNSYLGNGNSVIGDGLLNRYP